MVRGRGAGGEGGGGKPGLYCSEQMCGGGCLRGSEELQLNCSAVGTYEGLCYNIAFKRLLVVQSSISSEHSAAGFGFFGDNGILTYSHKKQWTISTPDSQLVISAHPPTKKNKIK